MDHNNSPKQSKTSNNPRRIFSGLLIDEIADDETGYDADVEILRPDAYDEPDSGKSEDGASSTESEEHSRNELVRHMSSLSCNPDSRTVSKETGSGRGRKRRSTDAFGASTKKISAALAVNQFEVTEVADDQDSRAPVKRARRRRRPSKVANGVVRTISTSESEREGNASGNRDKRAAPEHTTTTRSPTQSYLEDAMELD